MFPALIGAQLFLVTGPSSSSFGVGWGRESFFFPLVKLAISKP